MTLAERIQLRAARALLSLPPGPLARLVGRPKTYRGAKLDPRVQLALRLSDLVRRPTIDSLAPAAARREQKVLQGLFDIPSEPVSRVFDRRIAGVPVRVYQPATGILPALVYVHGGGFVIGDLDSYDAVCRHWANAARCTVISVDYRLAPENKFPAAVEDVFAVYSAVRGEDLGLEIDRARVAIAGDSAGGNLSAVVAQTARDRGVPQPILQILIYPACDARGGTTSRQELASGYFLTRSLIDYFHGHYGAPEEDIRMSPGLGRVEGLGPVFVQTCGFDPLRDEAAAYAERLMAAGVRVEHRCYETQIHGALAMAGYVPDARVMVDDITSRLRAAFERA